MKTVTVVIPTYNSEKLIEQTLKSVFAQSYKNTEIIVIDDGSTDLTREVLDTFSGDIKILHQRNRGRGAARNAAVNQSKDGYIAFLDHDDLLLESSVYERVEYLEKNHGVGWVFTDAMEFDDCGDLRLYLAQFPWLDLEDDAFNQILRGCFPLTSTVMIRSGLLRQVGGFNTEINYGDDLELFLRLSLLSKVGFINKALTRRRIHGEQGVSNTFDRWNSRVEIYNDFSNNVGEMTFLQEKSLTKALKYAYFKLGECRWEKDDFAEAQRMFISSLGLSPNVVKALCYALFCNSPFLVKTLRALKGTRKFQ